jgi:hypothetical protein
MQYEREWQDVKGLGPGWVPDVTEPGSELHVREVVGIPDVTLGLEVGVGLGWGSGKMSVVDGVAGEGAGILTGVVSGSASGVGSGILVGVI